MVYLEFCKRSDPRYQAIRSRHYVPNSGTHGQQLHFLIYDDTNELLGIISGASSVYGVKSRDNFFHMPPSSELKESLYLPAIVNNTVFRLEVRVKNLASEVLALWRKVVAVLWERLYGVPVIGFETFVVEEDTRRGTLYLADNWTLVGETVGSTKRHGRGGATSPAERLDTSKKLVLCRWRSHPTAPKVAYTSSWRSDSAEERERAQEIAFFRRKLLGTRFSRDSMPVLQRRRQRRQSFATLMGEE